MLKKRNGCVHRWLFGFILPNDSRTCSTIPGARYSKVPRTFRARKAIRKITTCLFCKADLFTCCKGNKNRNNGKVSCFETPSFWRYIENYVTRNTPETFRDFRETGPGTESSGSQSGRVGSDFASGRCRLVPSYCFRGLLGWKRIIEVWHSRNCCCEIKLVSKAVFFLVMTIIA